MKTKNSLTKKIYSKVGDILVKSSVKLAVEPASVLSVYQPKAPKNLK